MKFIVTQLLYIYANQCSILLLTVASHEPTYLNLLPYMERVDNWKALGTHLLPVKYIPHLLDEIERTRKGNVDDCRRDLLSEFIKVGEVSWDKVIDSLEKSRYSNVAKIVKQDISKFAV